MNLTRHIRQIIREEITKNLKSNYLKYEKLLDKLVNEIFGDNICGFNWETFKLHHREGTQIRIILYVDKIDTFEVYFQKKQELHDSINNFFPKFNGVFIVTDTTKCGKDLNESEITERCWKGYTQKGMKTMFGKRYPNCVKIKKKRESKEGVGGYAAPAFEMEPDHVHFKHLYNESIRRIIREEVQKKYPKPTQNVEKLVYKWLNDYFDGAQMYHNKSWESTHSFEFCNNGKEIMDVTLYFNNDDNVYDDKRKTEERDFESGSIVIPRNILNELSSDIPVRISYLKYIFEEWFDDTYLGEIQKFMGRNDIYISEFDIRNKDAEVCVPPVTKPEDVTQEEMIELILKTTLFKRGDILRREEGEPGFIEKIYLGKLRDAEEKRLRGNN